MGGVEYGRCAVEKELFRTSVSRTFEEEGGKVNFVEQ